VIRALAALAVVFLSCGAQAARAAGPAKVRAVEGITEYRLDNGLVVLLVPDPSRPRVTVNLTVLVGSRHEGYGEAGMAHLLEHMVFKGTPTHPDIPKEFKERGASWNGTTDYDRTNYFETLPASDENLAFALGLEADRLVHSAIRGEDLKTEFTVVRNEFESGENSPSNILEQRMMATAFEWHNYGKSVIGNRSDIERVPVDRLRAFYRKYYQPDNAVLVVAGQFDEAKALRLIDKTFGAIPRPGRTLETTYTEEPAQDGERVVTLRRVGAVGMVGLAYHVPAGPHPETPAFQVLARVLTDPPSGRLYQALVASKKAAGVRARDQGLHDPGALLIFAEVRGGQSADEARDTMLAVVEGLKDHPVTAEEVERAKRKILKDRELAAADSQRLALGLSEWAAQGDWRLYFLDRDRTEAVTADRVNAAAARYLARNNRTVGLYVPTESPERVPVPATPALAAMIGDYKGRAAVAAGDAFDVAPEAIESKLKRTTLPEGLKVVLLPKKTRGESVTLRLALRYGDAEGLKGMTTAAGLLPELMTRGTKSLNRQQLQDELDRRHAQLRALGAPGAASFALQTKRADLPAALELLREVLREPSLPESEFEVLRQERLAAAERQRTDPMRLGFNQLARLLSDYPEDDVRYEASVDEQVRRLKAASLDQVRRLHAEFLGAGHGELAVVGDFDADDALSALSKALGGWKATRPYARIEKPYQAKVEPGRRMIATPDKANALFAAGLNLPLGDDHPDYPALVVGNYVLGGGALSSRLGDRLRQKEGFSYGAGSMLGVEDPKDERASLRVMAICNPAVIAKVEAAALEEIERLVRDGVSADEVAKAKEGYVRQQRLQRANDNALVTLLAARLHAGRTLRYDAELESKLKALTPEAVSAALKAQLDPRKLSTVRAGDLKSPESSNP
jgi:zinc protease